MLAGGAGGAGGEAVAVGVRGISKYDISLRRCALTLKSFDYIEPVLAMRDQVEHGFIMVGEYLF